MQNSLNIYGHVTDGTIDDGPCQLPRSWKKVSGLDNLSSERLTALGWLPWILVEVQPGQNQVRNGESITIEATRIVQTQLVRDMTPVEIQQHEQQLRDANKQQASQLLLDTDWTELPSVSNTELNPHLTNQQQFIEYRGQLRAIAVNPPLEVTEWPDRPAAEWNTDTL